jgi:acetylornithine deacetylase/succinyl-diaminopimelate desuccinylase-like protein
MEITVEGKSSHTATKQDGVNAIVMMSRVIPHLENMKFTGWKPHPVLQGEPVISVNAITGGLRDNIVPDKCSVVVDIRFLPGMTIDDITANVRRVLDDLKRSDPALKDLKYSLRSVAVGRPVFISPNEPFVGLMSKAVEAVTERIPIPKGSFASSDSRWIVLDAGIPTINFSMGNDSGHKPNEYVPIEDYIKNIKIYALIMLMYLT